MKTEHIEVFSEAINKPVLRMPGRKFPGILLQGDTVSSLYSLARMLAANAEKHADPEMTDLAQQMKDELSEILSEYEHVLKANNLSLPYVTPF